MKMKRAFSEDLGLPWRPPILALLSSGVVVRSIGSLGHVKLTEKALSHVQASECKAFCFSCFCRIKFVFVDGALGYKVQDVETLYYHII